MMPLVHFESAVLKYRIQTTKMLVLVLDYNYGTVAVKAII